MQIERIRAMKKSTAPKFKDSPGLAELISVVDLWRQPQPPVFLKNLFSSSRPTNFRKISDTLRVKISSTNNPLLQKRLEKLIIGWLYDFIRLNVKRGRVFDLGEVLKTGQADCLGYAKLFTALGRYCGLDSGVIEVIIDNRGRIVPHTAILVKLPDDTPQFIDFWYGSKDIRHQRLGLRIKHGVAWQVEDTDYQNFKKAESVTYLPDHYINGITLYIEGNRSLKNRDYRQTIRQYSESIRLYPQNSRTFYNRAVAYENLGQLKKAKTDYARALRDNASLLRTLATQPEDIVDLIRLDEEDIPETDQKAYLLYHGFITGRQVSPAVIAKKTGLSIVEVVRIVEKTRIQGLSR
jgi:tetratricopeptide (TPR) repeat protein